MKILMLTPYLPYPPSSGGQVRTFNLIKYLSKNNEITLISLYKFSEEKKYLRPLKKFCSEIHLCKRAEKPWQLKNIFKSVFSNRPFLIVRNYSEEAYQVLKKLLSENHYDVIHAETFYIMPHLPNTKVPIILVEQTIEYKVYQHFVHSLPFFLRPFFYLDIVKLIYWERYFWRKANLVATVSESDRAEIRKLEPMISPEIVPNGAGDEMLSLKLASKDLDHPKLLFMGNFFWLQNVEAAQYLVNNIYPLVTQHLKQAKLIIAGQNATNKLGLANKRHLEIINVKTDDIKTVKKLYKDATLFVSPIYGPGGTRLKILAAMAAGLPIVSSKTGIQGLDLKPGTDVLIADTISEFIKQIERILADRVLFQRIQKNSYKLVRQEYSWEKIALNLEQVYRKLTKEHK
jgi:glycosyltransferase involved in cell wall biosynthesis